MNLRAVRTATAIVVAVAAFPHVTTAKSTRAAVCTQADRPVTFLKAVTPKYDSGDFLNGLGSLFVQVNVAVDAAGRPTEADARYSTNAALRERAVTAAMQSTYRAAIKDCVPVDSQYVATIAFDNNRGYVGSGKGEVVTPVGYAEIVFLDTVSDDDLAMAGTQSRTKIDELRVQLARAAPSARITLDEYSLRARESRGDHTTYDAWRNVRIRVDNLREILSAYQLARNLMHFEYLGVTIHPKDAEDAYDRAFALALVDARADADHMAVGAQHHTGLLNHAEAVNVYNSVWTVGDPIPAQMHVIVSVSADFMIAP